MKPKIAMNWIEALRSGEYEQGRHCLKLGNKYCCLGVLNDLYPQLDLSGDSNVLLNNYKKIGLYDGVGRVDDGIALANLNDQGYTFDEIADIIQIEYVEGL